MISKFPSLNEQAFLEITGSLPEPSAANGERLTRDSWYRASEPLFCEETPIQNWNDVIRLIAFAYSWMPTIPKIPEKVDSSKVVAILQRLKSDATDLEKSLPELIALVNNSIVGTSKVLFFLNPTLYPILDSRTVKGWNLRLMKYGLDKLSLDSSIDKLVETYLYYRKVLLEWQRNCGTDWKLRDLEACLYEAS